MRTVTKAVMPMSGGTIRTGTRKHINGKGAGAVLLDGGLGGQSSYHSLDDYINTTGVNPLASVTTKPLSSGKGLASMNKQIENLLVKSKKLNPKKEKNINFNL